MWRSNQQLAQTSTTSSWSSPGQSQFVIPVEEMIGHYLGEFSITYKPIKHGRAGMMGKNSQFVPLK